MGFQSFQERLRWARLNAGFDSARQAARAHGWNENTYRAHEAGIRGAPNERTRQYARAYRVDYFWLLEGQERMAMAASVAASGARQLSVVEAPPSTPEQRNAPIIGIIIEGGVVKLSESSGAVAEIPTFLEYRDDYAVLSVANHHDLWPFAPGWQLFFEPAEADTCVGELCLVFTTDGNVFVKRLIRTEDDTFNLEHFNPMVATMDDVEIVECYRLAGTACPR